ncbi:hypothetical protein BJY04DRAFT_230439 [Aspergillus karnatakaensis]|uniref:archaemetzincin n=1 Tax=Aspergillus karnatakaensis TaxID=1810916 RepID=UPI003CCD391F
MPVQPSTSCPHGSITYTPSRHATLVNYTQLTQKERENACKPFPPARASPTRTDIQNFPAPLILPDDELALDPEYPPQSFQEWYDEEERNPISHGVAFMAGWSKPHLKPPAPNRKDIEKPEIGDVVEYLKAFFHGPSLAVKELKIPSWKFTPWTEDEAPAAKRPRKTKSEAAKQTEFIGVSTSKESIRIRTRPSPTPSPGNLYTNQLNLDDLLDVAISILPKDAYALCMLVDQDLYEDEDDLFVCGRAYGGSRVAVVSTARYHPSLDKEQGVERGHAWPGSHCSSYIEQMCQGPKKAKSTARKSQTAMKEKHRDSPLESAMRIFSSSQACDEPNEGSLWLYRTVRTVSHELSHCLGLDHCVYYACIMQGSASVAEDARQPPYLCPVDLAKVLAATGSTVGERERALLEFCEGERNLGISGAYNEMGT